MEGCKEIGMIAQGVASVKVERVEKPIPYKPEDTKLPKVDFEVAETEYDFQTSGELLTGIRKIITAVKRNK